MYPNEAEAAVNEKLKAEIAYQQHQQERGATTPYGAALSDATMGLAQDCAKRETLTGRIHTRCRHAVRESRRANELMELEMLLAKHPDIARMLDLIESVGR